MSFVRLVRQVLHEETGPYSNANLKTSFLASHSLSNYQKMERMMKLPLFGDCKLLVRLAAMLEYCSRVDHHHFRIPLRMLLSKDDPADVRAIADKADCLITMHELQGHNACWGWEMGQG
jgi:hypothetical protein